MLAAGISLLALSACSKQHAAAGDYPQAAANGGQQSSVIEMQLPSETETSPFILNDAANAIAQWSHPSGKPVVERKNLERMLDLEQRALQHCGDQKVPEGVVAYVYTSEGGEPHEIRSAPPGSDHALSITIQHNIDEVKKALGEVASKSAPH
jgi:hypothetical protein